LMQDSVTTWVMVDQSFERYTLHSSEVHSE
jgi:hypothetical protein